MTYNDYYLCHHGILGQKWGIRRYQNADGSLTDAGRKRYSVGEAVKDKINQIKYGKTYDANNAQNTQTAFGKTRYTNLDGTLNEKGKKLAATFAQKEIDRNNKYYDKMIKKYNEAAEVYKDDKEKSDTFKKMAESAQKSRDETNENLKNMSLNQIMETQAQRNQKKIGIVGAVAGLIGAGGLVTAAAGNIKKADTGKLFDAIDGFDPTMPMQKLEAWANSEKGAKAMNYVDSTIRAYSDVRAYVLGTMIDQSMVRLNNMGVPQTVGQTAGKALNEALNSSGYKSVLRDINMTEGDTIRNASALNDIAMKDVRELVDIYNKNKKQ